MRNRLVAPPLHQRRSQDRNTSTDAQRRQQSSMP
jgi:hypothetical protein